MPRRVQITVPIANQPGTLAGVTQVLGAGGIGIRSLTTFEGQVHLVAENPEKASAALRQAGYPCLHGEILEVQVARKPGSLGALAARLAAAGVNIDYAYSGPGEGDGTASVFLAVSDLDKADSLA